MTGDEKKRRERNDSLIERRRESGKGCGRREVKKEISAKAISF